MSIVTIIIFYLFNASLLNNSINLFFKKLLTPHFWTGAYVYWIEFCIIESFTVQLSVLFEWVASYWLCLCGLVMRC